ncbi:2-octaprenyl-6-methoxyphenyl hydroxylase [Parasalinivibrio latis]|uniref:2-octaprenyl-6-methoxyphenyl hydroxylase n=1 Tax=Parasalinivibrio latis TaxID=2952610 RepID=UPI0030E26393
MKHYDVVIAGGAMAGATLALALNRLSRHKLDGRELAIAVVEAVAPELDSHPGYDARSIALALGSCRQLDDIGIWQALEPFATPIKHIHVSDRGHCGMASIAAPEYGVPFLGNVVELADCGRVFHDAMSVVDNITLYCPDSVTDVTRSEEKVSVTLESGEIMEAGLLVAADGAVSASCDALGITRDEHDFSQVAVIANVSTSERHQGRAFERFTEHGPVALLPMSQGRSSLVWCLPPHEVEDLLRMDDEAFANRLQQAFGWRLGEITQVGERFAYPLILRRATRTTSHRFAVVGNAAQTLHPIAGQGFNLGLRDVMSLAEEVVAGLARGERAGDFGQLSRYRQRREQDREETVMLTAGLVYGFSSPSKLLAAGRNLGLMAMAGSQTLKTPLVQRTMGLVTR